MPEFASSFTSKLPARMEGTFDFKNARSTTKTMSLADMGFLALAGLDKYEEALTVHGFVDRESLFDHEVLDDVTLATLIGMTKIDIRKFRDLISTAAKKSSSTTQSKMPTEKEPGLIKAKDSQLSRRMSRTLVPTSKAELYKRFDDIEGAADVSVGLTSATPAQSHMTSARGSSPRAPIIAKGSLLLGRQLRSPAPIKTADFRVDIGDAGVSI